MSNTIEEFLAEIELGLGSAETILNECTIHIPEDHPDPKAIYDCITNVKEAYAFFKRNTTRRQCISINIQNNNQKSNQ